MSDTKVQQALVHANDLASFMQDFQDRKINLNIMINQPYSFEQNDAGGWYVDSYLLVYLAKKASKVARSSPSGLILPSTRN